MTESGYIYFIADDVAGAVKVGWSADPRERLHTLQVGSPAELRLVGYFPDDGEGLTEASLHDRFAPHRRRGEWFELGADELRPYLEVAAEYAEWHATQRRPVNAALLPVPAEIRAIAQGWAL